MMIRMIEDYKAIIFDLDNTLLDRTQTFHAFARKLAAKYFSHLTEAQQEEAIAVIIEKDEDGYKDKKALFAELTDLLPWQETVQAHELLAFYEEEYVNSAELMEGALQLLDWCNNRCKVGLITNGRHVIQDGKLNRLQIKHYFHSIVISESAGVKKPNIRIFDLCLEQLELSPEECVYVGDHPVNDIDGAAKAGLETIWIKVNQPWRDEIENKPALTVTSLQQLHDFLEKGQAQ